VGGAGTVGPLPQAITMYSSIFAIRGDVRYRLSRERAMGNTDSSFIASVKTVQSTLHPVFPAYPIHVREKFLAAQAACGTQAIWTTVTFYMSAMPDECRASAEGLKDLWHDEYVQTYGERAFAQLQAEVTRGVGRLIEQTTDVRVTGMNLYVEV
jgi:hypothetical protein